jgi:NAD(P)-dependent dehydrogenase (short-subunit alcohol dehydrogenase family)
MEGVMKDLFSLKGRTALVTGGSRGIGRMIAEGFVHHGAKVYISARKGGALEETAKELSKIGPCIALTMNASGADGAKAMAALRELLDELEAKGWRKRLDLQTLVFEDQWGQLANEDLKASIHNHDPGRP